MLWLDYSFDILFISYDDELHLMLETLRFEKVKCDLPKKWSWTIIMNHRNLHTNISLFSYLFFTLIICFYNKNEKHITFQ